MGLGESVSISGTSSDDNVNTCRISVQLNDRLLLNQRVMATGPGGFGDYSQWSFTASPGMEYLREGRNAVTVKISCPGNVALDPYDTINLVVGVR